MAVLAVCTASPAGADGCGEQGTRRQPGCQKSDVQPVTPLPPAGPPPPTLAPARLQARPVPTELRSVGELHELHPELRVLAAPARDGLMPLTLLSAGYCSANQWMPVMQQSPELRGLFSAWLRSLAGDDGGANASDWGARLSVDMWVAHCVDGAWQPLGGPCDASSQPPADCSAWPQHLVASDGAVAGSIRHPLASVHDGVEILARLLGESSADASFVAVGVELRRYVPELGCTAPVSAIWVDIAAREFTQESACLQSLRGFLQSGALDPNAGSGARSAALRGSRPEVRGHPLLALLAPALRGERALALVVVGPHEAEAQDVVTAGANELARTLLEHVPSSSPLRQVEATSVREGFARGSSSTSPALQSFSSFAGSFRDICDPPSSPMQELLRGDVSVKTSGFPGHLLPSLNPYMSRFVVTTADRKVLIAAAEAEIAEFEENRWYVHRPDEGAGSPNSTPWLAARPTGFGDARAPAPLYVHLADCYAVPETNLTTTVARSYCRAQDQADPLVRTIRRLREDISLAVALLPLCAAHPFNPVRLLRLGGVHSLLSLLSDASSLAPGHEEGQLAPAVESLAPAEVGGLALTALAAFASVRVFLVSQSILELLAVAIRHPASDRHLVIFAGLLTRLCRDPEHRRLAAEVVSPALAEQIPKLLGRGGRSAALAEALLAAAASLSPFLPAAEFAPVLRSILGHLTASAAPAFHHFACALASSLQRNGDIDLGTFVPRLLSLVPIQPPAAADFHSGAAALLALCSHTAATTSLSRRWVAAAAIAVTRASLRGGPAGLAEICSVIPLATVQESSEDTANKDRGNEWYSEVEETISLQSTLRWTHGNGFFPGGGSHGGTFRTISNAFGSSWRPTSTTQVPLRDQRLHGWTRLLRTVELAESPNTTLFHEAPQIRIVIPEHADKTEVFISIALLPATHCPSPCSACGCTLGGNRDGCGGQLGLWLCSVPDEGDVLDSNEVRGWRHQLDLRAPLHASAAEPGKTEHLVSVTLPRGSYTLIPFTSHTVGADASLAARSRCHSLGCGCVDVNLMQGDLWDRSSSFTAVAVWAECTELEVSTVLPNYLRVAVAGELLMQSIPLWIQARKSCGPTEVLLCISSDGTDSKSLRGSEPCLDLWPQVPHRRVRNERTGALRIHIPALMADQPLRVTCLWQEGVDPAEWQRAQPRLLIYSSSPVSVHAPPPCPVYPALESKVPDFQAGRWQAAMLLTGAWTAGFSSGFGNLRNPQVILEVPRAPGRAEELQLDFYLSIPVRSGDERKRPTPALTVFAHQEQRPHASGPPERMLEGQLRKELGASKAAIGGYVAAHMVLNGAETRQPLFVVLQNSEPHEGFPWQLRVLARIRPCLHAANGKLISGAAAQSQDEDLAHIYEAEVPDDPPIRCAVVGGTSALNRIYGCWPNNLALYVPKPSRGELPEGNSERVVSWVQSRRAWGQHELLDMDATLGPAPNPSTVPWLTPEPLTSPDDELHIHHMDAAVPGLMLASQAKAPSASESAVVRAHAVADPVEGLALKVPVAPSRRVPPRPPEPHRPQGTSGSEPPNGVGALHPSVPSQASQGFRAPMAQRTVRGSSEPRKWRVEARAEVVVQNSAPETSNAVPYSERHVRVAALLRRRRQGHGYNEDNSEASSLPPPQIRGTEAGGCSSRPPIPRRDGPQRDGPPEHRGDSSDQIERGGHSAMITMPSLPPSPRAGPARPLPQAEERQPSAASSPKGGASPSPKGGAARSSQPSLPVILPQVRPDVAAGPQSPRSAAGVEEKGNRCCHFSGHPIFCCRAEAQRSKGPPRHLVKLERRPGADRLGFGNVAAGPKDAPVLVISWVRDGALASWNDAAPEGMQVPPQSAIVSVNGVARDVLAMREQLRAQLVELEIIAPDRWRWNQVVNAA